jgi:glycosyltransferase involved in cell wall biosynthesis
MRHSIDMKILFSHYLLDDDNPPVRTVHAISRELRGLGNEVHVHRSYGPARPMAMGAGGSVAGRPGLLGAARGAAWFAKAALRNLPMYRNDLRAIAAVRPDVVLARQDAYCLSMALAAQKAGLPLVTYADVPVAYESRVYYNVGRWHPPGLVEAMEKRGLAPSRAVIATSYPTIWQLAEYGLDLPMRVVPNGLHPERFPELSEDERRAQRRALGIEAPLVVGFQGTFLAIHGVDRLRDLMLELSPREDVHWLVIGDGPLRAGVEAAVAGRVRATFLGRRPPEEMGRLLALMDVAVAPHTFVPGIFYLSPLKIIESAAAGCTVVASRQGDIPWLLDNGRAGIILDDPDIAAWTAAIHRALDDPDLRRSLGQAARRYVLEHFTWRRIAEQYDEILRWALDGGRASGRPIPPSPLPEPEPEPEPEPATA